MQFYYVICNFITFYAIYNEPFSTKSSYMQFIINLLVLDHVLKSRVVGRLTNKLFILRKSLEIDLNSHSTPKYKNFCCNFCCYMILIFIQLHFKSAKIYILQI